jgi:hypothetical protein
MRFAYGASFTAQRLSKHLAKLDLSESALYKRRRISRPLNPSYAKTQNLDDK